MFDALLDRSSGERSAGTGFLALSVLFAYVVIATIVAGGFAVPAGLFVFALGCLATVIVDHAYWRESAFAPVPPPSGSHPERLSASGNQAALPPPGAREGLEAAAPDRAAASTSET